jgi:antitoxin (DNA-binding transcriptional repressor) of toxin-antitoxin stability system
MRTLSCLSETCDDPGVKSMTIRDLRQRWPEAEKALEIEKEILITRNGQPVAKWVRIIPEAPRQKRWSPEEHLKWMKKVWGKTTLPSSDEVFSQDRADKGERS